MAIAGAESACPFSGRKHHDDLVSSHLTAFGDCAHSSIDVYGTWYEAEEDRQSAGNPGSARAADAGRRCDAWLVYHAPLRERVRCPAARRRRLPLSRPPPYGTGRLDRCGMGAERKQPA